MNQKLENLYLVHDRFNTEYRHIKEQNDRLKMSDEKAIALLDDMRERENAMLVKVLMFDYSKAQLSLDFNELDESV